MTQLLLFNKSQLFRFYPFAGVLLVMFFSTSCNNSNPFGIGGTKHCSEYTYNKEQKTWVDATGQQANCTILDNERIFYYNSQTECQHWETVFKGDPTVKFKVVPIKVNHQFLATKYCVKERYIELDNSDQALILGDGAFCLHEAEENKKEYRLISCEGEGILKKPKG